MAELLLTVGFGICLSLMTILVLNLVLLKNWRLLPAILSQFTVISYFTINYFSRSFEYNAMLLVAFGLSLIAITSHWTGMLKSAHNFLMQWLLVLCCLLILILNQFIWSSLLLFILPVWLCSIVIIAHQFLTLSRVQAALSDMTDQFSKTKLAVGLDLNTGLPNKLAFMDKVDKHIQVAPSAQFNVVVFKMTKFKRLNKIIGHQHSDLVKVQLATRVRNVLSKSNDIVLLSSQRQSAFLANLGGVDFCFAIYDSNKNKTNLIVEQLQAAIQESLVINATTVEVGIEFGIACYPLDGGLTQELLEKAYLALNHSNKNAVSTYFEDDFQHRFQEKRVAVSKLRDDLNHNKFQLFVQPQFNLADSRVVGAEIFIRWHRDDNVTLSADKFIELAEESGAIYQLSVWCFERTITQLAQMHDPKQCEYLAVNVSNKELFHTQLVDTIGQLLEKHSVAAERLVVEIKESAFTADTDRALKMVKQLTQLGVKIGIDGFGRNLNVLRCFNQFSPSYVKVDCKALGGDHGVKSEDSYIMALIGLANNLNIKTIAQNIESTSHIKLLQSVHCECVQGYFYSKPFDLAELNPWLDNWLPNKDTKNLGDQALFEDKK